jgi:hypothetical protein
MDQYQRTPNETSSIAPEQGLKTYHRRPPESGFVSLKAPNMMPDAGVVAELFFS